MSVTAPVSDRSTVTLQHGPGVPTSQMHEICFVAALRQPPQGEGVTQLARMQTVEHRRALAATVSIEVHGLCGLGRGAERARTANLLLAKRSALNAVRKARGYLLSSNR